MNKARAMLDALMGPGRDVAVKDKGASKERFKDPGVCKSFLAGLCPWDKELLGGKRKFQVCEKIHSELMRDQLRAHPEAQALREEYERLCLRDLEYVVRQCEAHIAAERQRIRDDLRRRKPALPGGVNDKLAMMKKESAAMVQRAEALDDGDDTQLREKAALITKAKELMRARDELQQQETKKAIEAVPPEEVCEVCGVSYTGRDGGAAHLAFRMHEAFVRIREHIAELQPRVQSRQAKGEEPKARGREEPERPPEKERSKAKAGSAEKERSRGRGTSRGKEGDASREKARSKGKGGRREKERSEGRARSRRRNGRARSRSPSGRSCSRDRSRSRRRR